MSPPIFPVDEQNLRPTLFLYPEKYGKVKLKN